MDENETHVIFRAFGKREGNAVIALFPTIAWNVSSPWLCTSYMHVGQHGSADLQAIINTTRPAKPDEFAALKAELESKPYGYRLKIYAKNLPSFRRVRQAQIDEWRKCRS